jgi:hypothetical protein
MEAELDVSLGYQKNQKKDWYIKEETVLKETGEILDKKQTVKYPR